MLNSLVLLVLFVGVSSIGLGIDSQRERCMIVSSSNQQHTLKLDAKFLPFDDQAPQEGYKIVLHNTETHEQQAFQTNSGIFRRQFTLTRDVVYRLCFQIVVSDGRKVQSRMQYNAAIKHSIEKVEPLIKVPQKLLKSHDLSETYTFLQKTQKILNTLKQNVDQVRSQEQAVYQQQKQKIQTLEWISIVELLIICLFGAYQFIKLKQIITNRRST